MARQKKKEEKFNVLDWLGSFISAVSIGIIVCLVLFRVVVVHGTSMFPTLRDGDKLLCCDLFYTPSTGDVVVFRPQREEAFDGDLIKRVIAVEGQTLDIDANTGAVAVDGKVLDEPYISEALRDLKDFSGHMVIPEGKVFVMGDNRNNSTDSRSSSVGLVDRRDIIGRALLILIPSMTDGGLKNFSRFGTID